MLDVNNCFTHDGSGKLVQALTTSIQLTNVIDLIGAASPTTIRLGEGKKKPILKIKVTVASGGLTSGGSFVVNTDDTDNVSSGRTVYDTGILAVGQLSAGQVFQIPLIGVFERYLGIDWVAASEAATDLEICSWVDEEVEPNVTAPDMDDTA